MKSARDGSSPNTHKIKSKFKTDNMAVIGYRSIGSLIGVDLIFSQFQAAFNLPQAVLGTVFPSYRREISHSR